jgi:hypothetical protein
MVWIEVPPDGGLYELRIKFSSLPEATVAGLWQSIFFQAPDRAFVEWARSNPEAQSNR